MSPRKLENINNFIIELSAFLYSPLINSLNGQANLIAHYRAKLSKIERNKNASQEANIKALLTQLNITLRSSGVLEGEEPDTVLSNLDIINNKFLEYTINRLEKNRKSFVIPALETGFGLASVTLGVLLFTVGVFASVAW